MINNIISGNVYMYTVAGLNLVITYKVIGYYV